MELGFMSRFRDEVQGLLRIVVVGLFTAPVAFILAGQMAVAYFMAHAPQGFWPIQNRGEMAALFSFVFLFFAAAGPGRFSLDGLLLRRTRRGTVDGS